MAHSSDGLTLRRADCQCESANPVNAAARAQALIAAAVSRTDNTYLSAKGLQGTQALTLADALRCGGISFAAGDVLIPMTGEDGTAVNVQLISAAGDKRTLPGGQVKAHIGWQESRMAKHCG